MSQTHHGNMSVRVPIEPIFACAAQLSMSKNMLDVLHHGWILYVSMYRLSVGIGEFGL